VPVGERRAMGEITRKIELFNLAYKLAWKHIPEDKKLKPDVGHCLDNAIRRKIKNGADDAVFIASEVLKDIEKT
jgi:hypothetical protein